MAHIPYGKQNITKEDINAVTATLQSDYLTQGPKINEFEDEFAKYIGSKYAVAVSNGTAALHLSALALSVNNKSRVITSPITFSASANCIRYCGGSVYFADIDSKKYTLDIDRVQELIETHPKGYFSGIIPVDFAGLPVNLEQFRELANEHDLWIIEDACHAPGGYFIDSRGNKHYCGNGNFADLAIFSFHPVKHIACGEGGMITTNNKVLYSKLLLLRTHGITKDPALMAQNHGGWYYEMQELGYNYRLPDINAALGLSQLSRAEVGLKRRREIAETYYQALKRLPLICTAPSESHAYHLYIIQTEKRLELYNYLRAHGIYTQVHYIPVHTLPYYQQLGWAQGDFPISEDYYTKCLSLPMYPSLSNEELNFVIENIIHFFNG